METRPTVSVYGLNGQRNKQLRMPDVFKTPVRADLINFVHSSLNKNNRQPYGVTKFAGHQCSAHSWGTGRAVARIPRVSGSGTHRAGQGAFGNMCRGGRMFAPTKTWRKWHQKVSVTMRRHALVSAIAGSANSAFVSARGHKINKALELPLVVSDEVQKLEKTKQAVQLLKALGVYEDVEKAKDSRKIRAGRGKARNRRYVQRKSVLVIYHENDKLVQAFRNLPGVDLLHVDRMNILQVAPGGHVGRLIVWTQSAFQRLDELYGTSRKPSELKAGYILPRGCVANSSITRIINSDEVQSKLRPRLEAAKRRHVKLNPLSNKKEMVRLNPYAKTLSKVAKKAAERASERRAAILAVKRGDKDAKAPTPKKVKQSKEVKKVGKKYASEMLEQNTQ